MYVYVMGRVALGIEVTGITKHIIRQKTSPKKNQKKNTPIGGVRQVIKNRLVGPRTPRESPKTLVIFFSF